MKVETSADHDMKVMNAALEAAWLRRCGPEGKPGQWWIPGELLDVVELHGIEVSVYPTWALLNDEGEIKSWSGHMGSAEKVCAWEWRFNIGWDDYSQTETEALEDWGFCLDDSSSSFPVLGDHQEKPPIPGLLADALAYLGSSEGQAPRGTEGSERG